MVELSLTKRQQEIFDFVKRYVSEHGYPPTVRDIGKAIGLTSSSTVHAHLGEPREARAAPARPTKPRAIEVLVDKARQRWCRRAAAGRSGRGRLAGAGGGEHRGVRAGAGHRRRRGGRVHAAGEGRLDEGRRNPRRRPRDRPHAGDGHGRRHRRRAGRRERRPSSASSERRTTSGSSRRTRDGADPHAGSARCSGAWSASAGASHERPALLETPDRRLFGAARRPGAPAAASTLEERLVGVWEGPRATAAAGARSAVGGMKRRARRVPGPLRRLRVEAV